LSSTKELDDAPRLRDRLVDRVAQRELRAQERQPAFGEFGNAVRGDFAPRDDEARDQCRQRVRVQRVVADVVERGDLRIGNGDHVAERMGNPLRVPQLLRVGNDRRRIVVGEHRIRRIGKPAAERLQPRNLLRERALVERVAKARHDREREQVHRIDDDGGVDPLRHLAPDERRQLASLVALLAALQRVPPRRGAIQELVDGKRGHRSSRTRGRRHASDCVPRR
jgi:hypothetical protein